MRPALRQDLLHVSLSLLLPGLCKAGRALFCYWVRPALRKAGRVFFPGRKLLSATCLAQGRLGGQITYTFEAAGLRFRSKRP